MYYEFAIRQADKPENLRNELYEEVHGHNMSIEESPDGFSEMESLIVVAMTLKVILVAGLKLNYSYFISLH